MAATALALGLALVAPTGAAAVGVGETCGTIVGIRCDKGLWCDFDAGKCGVADVGGKCIKIPADCTKERVPVCGCNKRTYSNDCRRQRAKAQKDHDGECKK
jgi:Kazal-type serine protease inhibitor domain